MSQRRDGSAKTVAVDNVAAKWLTIAQKDGCGNCPLGHYLNTRASMLNTVGVVRTAFISKSEKLLPCTVGFSLAPDLYSYGWW